MELHLRRFTVIAAALALTGCADKQQVACTGTSAPYDDSKMIDQLSQTCQKTNPLGTQEYADCFHNALDAEQQTRMAQLECNDRKEREAARNGSENSQDQQNRWFEQQMQSIKDNEQNAPGPQHTFGP
jgi:hypothetical protein